MKFLIDANLPFRLALTLRKKGFEIVHTDDLPNKERTTDSEIRNISVEHNLIIVTKDSDFLDSHLISGIPQKLLLVTTGNIINNILIDLFDKNFLKICEHFENYDLIEVSLEQIIVYER